MSLPVPSGTISTTAVPTSRRSIPTNSLDSPAYNPIDHLNAIFTHPSALASAPSVARSLRKYQYDLDQSISELVSAQAVSSAGSIERIQSAKAELEELFRKIDGVREHALQTEREITEMTADIKRLDGTKRNLTLSMTALKRLQMLTTAYEQLRGLARSRQYKDVAQLLSAVIQLMAHFKSYRSIDQIAALGKKVADIQGELLGQVCEDFETAFSKGEVAQKRASLADACGVLDALGEHARTRLITWYCNATLKEYRHIFRASDEAGSLDNIARRYAWFSRTLKTHDQEHAFIFPPYWRVAEHLASAFCEGTREDYKSILHRSMQRGDGQTLDVNVLLSCLQETLDFEHGLDRRFASASRRSTDTEDSVLEKAATGFLSSISQAFEPYLSLWVDAQDRHLASLIPKYRQQPLRNLDEEFTTQTVIPSSIELFQFYRLTLAQCAKLSTGTRLQQLTQTFAKYLDQYSQQVLFYFLGERTGAQGPSIEDIVLILNTADYCYSTCTQLEEKIKQRIDEEFKSQVDLQNQADAFMGIAGAAIRALLRKVEIDCEPSWREMRNISWSRMENVGDQSSYVGELQRHIKGRASETLPLLHKPQYSRAFCDNVVDSITNTYISSIVQCRPISEVGAEQMLLDFYVLRKTLTELPSLANLQQSQAPPAAYVKRATQATSKIDPLLKTLQVRPVPPEALVQAYLIHIADQSEANFRKILDLKGITQRQKQSQLIELFNAHRSSPSNGNLVANSALLTPIQLQGNQAQAGPIGVSVAATTIADATKFSPTSFGSAILGAARDGVDRFGQPAYGVATTAAAALTSSSASSAAPTRISSPPHGTSETLQSGQPANLNDNIRNIGKFFSRRDTGGFGRFSNRNVSSGTQGSTDDTR